MSPDRVETILADFRDWLLELPEDATPSPLVEPDPIAPMIAEFTALRHDVRLQTKATRQAVELLQGNEEADNDEPLNKAWLNALLGLADALALGHRQSQSTQKLIDEKLASFSKPAPTRQGWFSRSQPIPAAIAPETITTIRQQVAGLADGYAMSQRRVEQLLSDNELSLIECVGEPFDPEQMEAIGMVESDIYPSGTVVDEVRAGYNWRDKVIRYAQVRVAR